MLLFQEAKLVLRERVAAGDGAIKVAELRQLQHRILRLQREIAAQTRAQFERQARQCPL